ncbi:MAG: methylcrotonoyl-CoA carboxylase, partial [Hyphomicrobiales bacterium]
MAVLTSSIATASDEFKSNAAAMSALVDDLNAARAKAASGGSERSRERHLGRGKLLPRDRVMQLLDPGTPFLELAPMAAWEMYGGDIHAAGVITGIGRV